MASSITTAFLQYPTPTYVLTASTLGLFLDTTPDAVSSVVAISLLQLHSQHAHRRQNALRNHIILLLSLSLATSVAMLGPSLTALSSPAMSIITLYNMSLVKNTIALLIIQVNTLLSSRISARHATITLFPALWTSAWYLVALTSPVGKLFTWTPASGLERYEWLIPYTGSIAVDWVTSSWANILTQFVGSWFMGTARKDTLDEDELIGDLVDAPVSSTSPQAAGSRSLAFGGFLLALTIPSHIWSELPTPAYSPGMTPFSVGCILPTLARSKHTRPTLDDYIYESKQYANRADVLLWPESAVHFDNPEDRDAAFGQISREVIGSSVAVSFEETVRDVTKPEGRTAIKRLGVAIVNKDGVQAQYFKQHLVPVAESFSIVRWDLPPAIYELPLRAPKGVKSPDWAPAPKFTRPIPLTMSICLDFAFPTAFTSLTARPSLILAPGRTWHVSISRMLLEQTRLRAVEIGSTALWCDAGEESSANSALSGIVGAQRREPYQIGRGSWVQTIGIPYPFDTAGQTLYARIGSAGGLLVVWLVAISSAHSLMVVGVSSLGKKRIAAALGGSWDLVRSSWLHQRAPPVQEQDLLH